MQRLRLVDNQGHESSLPRKTLLGSSACFTARMLGIESSPLQLLTTCTEMGKAMLKRVQRPHGLFGIGGRRDE